MASNSKAQQISMKLSTTEAYTIINLQWRILEVMGNSNRNNEAVILYQVISGMTAKYRNDEVVSAVQDTVCGPPQHKQT